MKKFHFNIDIKCRYKKRSMCFHEIMDGLFWELSDNYTIRYVYCIAMLITGKFPQTIRGVAGDCYKTNLSTPIIWY
jgi:hypothetical protein